MNRAPALNCNSKNLTKLDSIWEGRILYSMNVSTVGKLVIVNICNTQIHMQQRFLFVFLRRVLGPRLRRNGLSKLKRRALFPSQSEFSPEYTNKIIKCARRYSQQIIDNISRANASSKTQKIVMLWHNTFIWRSPPQTRQNLKQNR